MLKRSDLRGLSKTTLIIMIAFIIILIAGWFVIKNIILQGSGERALGKYTLDLKISEVQKINDTALSVAVKRNIGEGEFVGINFIVEDDSNREIIQTNVTLKKLESRKVFLNLVEVNVSRIEKISISPIFKFGSEKSATKNIQDVYVFDSSDSEFTNCVPYCPPGAQCGDDTCGGVCGECAQQGYSCLDHLCIASLEEKCTQANIIVTNVLNFSAIAGGTNFSVTLLRQNGEDVMGGVKLVFTNELESSNLVVDVPGNIQTSEASTNYITILESHLANPNKIRTIVYFLDNSGMEEVCSPSSYVSF